ncbi:DNA repair protein RecN [Geothrix sp. PMB-07]|uniref:DNA repair protein RecN n=1 Tax=Geothrix sp. PMB-07 TaxID=3068640 RepID=UPI002741C1D9|nr:DNA repair protein RecN [Geothrix sp. PMB-07]WLT31178.1 DNA repair protein RecN [Geothrix sp. PMB-07]
MLASLRIQNLALVEDLSLEWGPGFTVLTGETGAGKSLLVDALSLLVGARGDAELVRHGSDRATVEAVVEGRFEAWQAFLADRGLPEEQPVVLRREVGSGRSRAWINGASCSLADLRDAGRLWMRLTSQHDHQSLLGEDRHLALIDEVLGLEPALEGEATAVREAEAALKARRRSEAEREQRLEQLAEALADLDKLAPKPGEWAQLKEDREPLRHAVYLEQAFREAAEALHEGVPQVELAHKALMRAVAHWPDAAVEQDRLRSAVLELEDLLALAQDQAQRWAGAGADRIEAMEARLALYERLARRQRCEPEELPGRMVVLREEQRSLLSGEASLKDLERALAKVAETYRAKAEALHGRRADAIPKLEAEVQKRLGRLGMKGARIQLRLSLSEESGSPVQQSGRSVRVTATGFSALAIWIEPNPGEGFRPLAKIASGGELSRLMLALVGAGLSLGSPAADRRDGLTLVLDEVDSGLGGETALAVGKAVAELGKAHQVLAVTHLAQVAARADRHGRLSKETEGGRTRSALSWVAGESRTRELARLLSGHPDRAEALEHAKVLLEG